MSDSLVIGENIELWGSGTGPVKSANPLCLNATFWLQTGFDLSAPQPTTDIVGSLLLDGERPFGYRASNRTITLPIEIGAPDFATLAAAREVLLQEINQQTWTLRWTRDVTGPLAGSTTPMPLLFDCFRAKASTWHYGGIDDLNQFPIGLMTITFDAAPYARSDVPVIVNFPSPLAGATAPPAPVTIDPYTAVLGNWLSGQNAGFDGGLGAWTASSGCSVATSTAQVFAGSHSMAITASGSGNAVASMPYTSGLPVKAGEVIAVSAEVRAAAATRTCYIAVAFYDVNGVFQSTGSSLGNADSNSAWTLLAWYSFATAPVNGYAVPQITIASPAASEVHYADSVLIDYYWAPSTVGPTGSSMLWDPGVAGIADGKTLPAQYAANGLAANLEQGWVLAPNQSTAFPGTGVFTSAQVIGTVSPGDQFQLAQSFLRSAGSGSVHNGDMEGTIGTWAQAVNCALADSAAQAHTGADSMSLTSTAAGNMSAGHTAAANYATNGLAVTPGQQVQASAWFRTAVSARSCQAGASFYNAAGTLLSTVYGSAVTDSTSGWTQATDSGLITAPPFAAWVIGSVLVQGTGAGAEVHYADDVALAVQASQVYTVTTVGASFFGNSNVTFTPATNPNVTLGDIFVQTGPAPNLSALTFYAGFGSGRYYRNWAILGGRVTFAVKLTDNAGTTLSFSRTVKCSGSNSSSAPVWHKLRIPVPSAAGFNYSSVAGYSITVTNRASNDLRYTQCFLASLQAVPAPTGLVAPSRGFVYDLAGIVGSARAPCSLTLQNSGAGVLTTKTISNAGGFGWTCPPGVTTVAVRSWGHGGNGSTVTSAGGGGGGSGGTAYNAAVPVTAGLTYLGFVQPGGAGAGLITTFGGDLGVQVNAAGGGNAPANSATGGTAGAAGTGGFAGAAGGLGLASTSGGGGASSAGTAGAGNAGATGAGGGAGGAAVAGGGSGGHGRPTGANSMSGSIPGGGGGGGLNTGNRGVGGSGANGQVTLAYTLPPSYTSAIVHRPPVTAPPMLSPFVSPAVDDIPNGTTEYPVQTLIYGIPARFAGTYNVIAVPYSWDTPANARTVTVTVKQYEQPGGAAYSQSASASVTPNSLPQLPGTPAGTGFADLGFMTLPGQDIPLDNVNAYFTVTVTSTDTSDRFMDVLFLDSTGSTVIIQSPTGYGQYFIDEPIADRDTGYILGTLFDRADSSSVLDRAYATGPPISVDPAAVNTSLLVYSMEGAPGLQMTYFPRWWMDRYA